MIKKKIDFWGLEIKKRGSYIINTLKIGKIMEQQNFISKKKIYTHKIYNIIKLFIGAQYAQYSKNILINIYISRYSRDIEIYSIIILL